MSRLARPRQCMSVSKIPLHQPPRMKSNLFVGSNVPIRDVVTPSWHKEVSTSTKADTNGKKNLRSIKFSVIKAISPTECFKWIHSEGYDSGWDSWFPRSDVHPEAVKDYERSVGVYDWTCKYRFLNCDLSCASDRGVKIHMGRAHKPNQPQIFEGRLADTAVQIE